MEKIIKQVSCRMCGNKISLIGTQKQWDDYFKGEKLIQNVFPEMPSEKREMLITRTCGSCWNAVFK